MIVFHFGMGDIVAGTMIIAGLALLAWALIAERLGRK